MLEDFGNWLGTFELWNLVNDHDWLWPLGEIIHFVGMALLIGSIGILDLRLLGIGKGIPFAKLEVFVPLAITGFLANAITGTLFVVANPTGGPAAYLTNLAFQTKVILMLLAGINALAFYFLGVSRELAALPADAAAPPRARTIAAASLFLWVFVIVFGRLIMYNDSLLWSLGM